MNISILTSTNPELRQKLQRLESDAPSDAKVSAGGPEPIAVVKARPAGNLAPSIRFASMRAALDARIATDTASGQLSANGAKAVKATLDEIDDGSRSTGRSAGGAGGQEQMILGRYVVASTARQAASQYLATIPRGTLVDRFG